MNSTDIQTLNEKFSVQSKNSNLVIKAGEADIPVIEIKNGQASALISLQGAHILSWIPAGQGEVIWLSKDATFASGKSIRGGIPICWPWFGAHGSNPDYPSHGFARTALWQILSTEALDDGTTRVILSMNPQLDNKAMWIPDTTIQFSVTIGHKLEMELITHNNGERAITLGQALHTYFKVSDVSKILLHGLDHTDYLDKLENFKRKRQFGPVVIKEEVDRIYVNTF